MMKLLQSIFTSIIQETDGDAQKQSQFLPLSFLPASPPRAPRARARTHGPRLLRHFFLPASDNQARESRNAIP
jgi:hypothetical protein